MVGRGRWFEDCPTLCDGQKEGLLLEPLQEHWGPCLAAPALRPPTHHPTVIVPAPATPLPPPHILVRHHGPSSVINSVSTSRQNLDTIVQVPGPGERAVLGASPGNRPFGGRLESGGVQGMETGILSVELGEEGAEPDGSPISASWVRGREEGPDGWEDPHSLPRGGLLGLSFVPGALLSRVLASVSWVLGWGWRWRRKK